MDGMDTDEMAAAVTASASNKLREKEVIEIIDDDNGSDHDMVDEDSEMKEAEPTEQQDMRILEDDSVQGFFEHTEPVYAVACCPRSPQMVITGAGDDCAYEWNLSNGEASHKLEGHSDSVVCVGYSHDGAMLATAGLEGVIRVFGRDGALLHNLDGPGTDIEWMKWHPKGNVLAAGTNDGSIWVWSISLSKNMVMQVLSGATGSVPCGDWTGDGKMIASGHEDGTVRIWSIRTGQVTCLLSGDLFIQGTAVSLHCHPTQPLVLVGSSDGMAMWAHLSTGKVAGAIKEHSSPVEAVAFAPKELGKNWAATACMDGMITVFDVDRGNVRVRCRHDDGVVKLQWLRHSPHLLCSCSLDGTVRVWDTRNGDCVHKFSGHQGPVFDFDVNSDESFIVSGGDDRVALVFPLMPVSSS